MRMVAWPRFGRQHSTHVALACVLAVLALPGVAHSAGTISGAVTSAGGGPIQGAVVTAASPDQAPVTATTAADGTYAIDVGGSGPYSVAIRATGFRAQSVRGVQPGSPQDFGLEPADALLPVYAGQVDGIAVDPTGGGGGTHIFYALASEAPDAYRSVDYGGSWQTMTPSYEDPDTGLTTYSNGGNIATSSVTGEVAVRAGNVVSYSTDYGLTWRALGGDLSPPVGGIPIGNQPLFWGHAGAGAPNVLTFARRSQNGSWSVWRANMDAPDPALVQEPSDPFGTGAAIAFADSGTGSLVGRVTAAGDLSFAPLTASGPIGFGPAEVTGLPTPPQLLRLGGAKEASAPPDGALVVGGNDPYTAAMATKSPGATSFAGGSLSAATALPAGCNFHGFEQGAGPGGSVAPNLTSGTSGAGSAGNCWLEKSGAGLLSVFEQLPCVRDFAYSPEFGIGGIATAFGEGCGRGPHRYARRDSNGVPVFEGSALASSGEGALSGGLSVNGITSAKVKDTVYGPAGADELAVNLHVGAGQLSLASMNGGESMTTVAGGGGDAVDWWRAASGEWLLFGHYSFISGNLLSAFPTWNGEMSTSGGGGAGAPGGPNVSASTPADFGLAGPDPYGVFSIAGVPGTNLAFIWLGAASAGGANHLYRVTLVAGSPPSLTNIVSLDASLGGATLRQPAALAYCPDAPSTFAGMGDVLFVANGGGDSAGPEPSGSLLRITGATSGSPSGSVVASIPHDAANTVVNDVRANCAAGVVYVGGPAGGPDALYKSTDGGVTFSGLGDAAEIQGAVNAIGLDPAEPTAQAVDVSNGTNILHSADGGQTWTLVYDPAVSRPATINDIEYPPTAGGPAALRGIASAAPLALVGTGAGVLQGDISATSGMMAAPGSDGQAGVFDQITTLPLDDHPSLTVNPASGATTVVFHRGNGLYESSERSGSWSIPTRLPGTSAADDHPAAALDASGRLQVAFARNGPGPGIYVASRQADGAWSQPQPVSTKAGDTLPALAARGNALHIVFLRTEGRSPGLYYASNPAGQWRRAALVRGTGTADAKPSLGGPSLAVGPRKLQLAFAGAGHKPGIYHSVRGAKWGKPQRLTTNRGDAEPDLALGTSAVSQIVFRRPRGHGGAGLVALRGGKKWKSALIPGTEAGDLEPDLAANGSFLSLAFARPTGAAPGIYYEQSTPTGRWTSQPRRWSGDLADANPSLGSDPQGHVTIVFERG